MSMVLCCPFRRRTSPRTGAWRARPARSGANTAHCSSVKLKAGETVMFSYIAYESRAQRDRITAKIIKDPRLAAMMDPKAMPFDSKRMLYGGFKVLVDL
jgi:uncharacterized protein YbaA (DUF1428 family)